MSLFLFCLFFHYLDSTCKWNHIFVFLWLTSLSITPCRSIHVAANGKISFFFYGRVIVHCVYAPQLFYELDKSLLWAKLWVIPMPLTCWSSNPQYLRCDCIWRQFFKVVIGVKWSHMDGPWSSMTDVLIKGDLDTDVRTKRKGHVRTQWEGGHLQAKERVLRRNQPYWQLDLGLLPSRTMRR